MKTDKIEFPSIIINALDALNVDEKKLANSVHTALCRAQADGEKSKLGAVRLTKSYARFSESTTTQFIVDVSEVGVRFKNFCDGIAALQKHHGQNWEVRFPSYFDKFLDNHKKAVTVAA